MGMGKMNSNDTTFAMGYALTEVPGTSQVEDSLLADMHNAVKRVPTNEYLFI